jgi:hypothetical protein
MTVARVGALLFLVGAGLLLVAIDLALRKLVEKWLRSRRRRRIPTGPGVYPGWDGAMGAGIPVMPEPPTLPGAASAEVEAELVSVRREGRAAEGP